MSNAEREITGRAVLFRKTMNGKTVFSNRFVEWTVHYLSDYATVVERAPLFLNDRCCVKMESKRATF